MGLTTGGVSVDAIDGSTIDTSGASSTDGGDSSSFDWSDVFSNIPAALTGTAALVNAFNKTPANALVGSAGVVNVPAANSTWMYLGIGLVILVVIVLMMGKKS